MFYFSLFFLVFIFESQIADVIREVQKDNGTRLNQKNNNNDDVGELSKPSIMMMMMALEVTKVINGIESCILFLLVSFNERNSA